MKVRWRQHEATLVTIIAILLMCRYMVPFMHAPLSFDYFTRVLLPQMGSLLVLLLAYFWANKLIVLAQKAFAGKSLWTALAAGLQAVILIYVIGPGVNFLSFYINPYYRGEKGTSAIALTFGFHPQPFVNTFGGWDTAAFLFGLYVIYASLREVVIHHLKKHQAQGPYRVMVVNQVTLCAIVFFIVPVISWTFDMVTDSAYYHYYWAFIPALLLVFNTNVYVLFPKKGDRAFFTWQVAGPLLFMSFVYTLAFSFFLGGQWSLPLVLALWAAQILIITPLSWLDFQQRKDRILQWWGVEKALVRSTADLQFLRMQINPHFLFNVLNTLYATALMEGSKKTAEGIQKLGDMMRFMLHENTLEYIAMNKEMEYLKNYIALQKLRMQTQPECIIRENIPEEACDHRIAPMLLIPMVENAFKHGVSLTEKSWINITLECNGATVRFEVHNSLHASDTDHPETQHSGIGLQNVTDRLALLYPGKHEFNHGVLGQEFVARLSVDLH